MNTQHLHPAERLKRLRKRMHLSQRKMAKEFMVSSGAIASCELGSNPIPGPVIRLIDLYEQTTVHSEEEQESLFAELRKTLKNHRMNEEDLTSIENALDVYFKDTTLLNSLQGKFKYALTRKFISYLSGSKGLTIKAAQLASYLEIGLPVEVRLALGNLQSGMKPMPKKILQETLERALGGTLESFFSQFDHSPIAVTSLGQVHYAKMKNGEEVAVKVQYPDIQKILQSQLKKIEFLEKIGNLFDKEGGEIIAEIKRAVMDECDYFQEAKYQEKVRGIFQQFPRAVVPKVHLNLTRRNVLVSEFIHGENFNNFIRTASQDSKNVVAEALIKCLTHATFSHQIVFGDIHPENFLIKNDKIVFLDFGRIFRPSSERMRFETMFYHALILNDKEKARVLADQVGFAKDPSKFDFDEFWLFLQNSSTHLLIDSKFRFTRDYVARISREGRRYSQKKSLKLSPEAFWAFTFSAGTWALFAELEAECNWHRLALETFNEALGFTK